MKLAVLGGGGVRSPFLAKSIALGAADTGITETVFMDTDIEKLNIYGKIAKHISEMINPNLAFTLTDNAAVALRDADFIITTIRAEADAGRVFDERTAINQGVIGQETTGAGGFAMALRSIPTLIEYCNMAKSLAKENAPIFNFTNPSGLVTQALRTMGYNNVYGVCDAPSGFVRQLRDMLGLKSITFECYGLNHLSWFYDFKSKGNDVTDDILRHDKLYTDTEMRLFSEEILELSEGFFPNEYLYFFHFRDKVMASLAKTDKTRGETILEINNHMTECLRETDIDTDFDKAFEIFMTHYAMRENSYFSIESGSERHEKFAVPTASEYIKQPENGSYAAVALEFIKARNTGIPVEMVLSVPNEGAIDFLEGEDVCELTCTVDRDGVHPHKIPYIPEMQKELIRSVKLYENLTVQAIIERDKRKAVLALMTHPLVGSYSVAASLVDSYTAQYEKYIGKWRG